MSNDKEQLKALQEKLKSKGVKIGEWSETKEHKAEIPILSDQLSLWKKTKGLLEEQVKKDQEKLAELQEMLDRIKHGGGR